MLSRPTSGDDVASGTESPCCFEVFSNWPGDPPKAYDETVSDTLATLNWLVEAGADEAVAEQPVNLLVARPNPPLQGGSEVASRSGGNVGDGSTTRTANPSP